MTTDVHTGALLFTGNVEIDIVLTANTHEVVLHSQNLNIISVIVYDVVERMLLTSYTLDPVRSFLIIALDEFRFINSKYKIVISYSGNLLTNSQGCHRSAYGTEPNVK